jgi:trk system potassium uptake protein TrkA
MKILIVGLGSVGSHLATILATEGHSVTVVDSDPYRLQQKTDTLDVTAIQGDGSHPDVLDRAGADAMDLLLAVSNDDNANMLCCLFGKRIGSKTAVLRVKDMTPFTGFRTFFKKNLLFDLVLSLEDLASEEIVNSLRQNQQIAVDSFADGRVQMRRIVLADDSTLLGAPIKDLRLPEGVLIATRLRGNDVEIPEGSSELRAGDVVYVVGYPKAVAALEKKSGVRSTTLKSVVAYGASSITSRVCEALQKLHVQVRLIVQDRAAAEQLSSRLRNVIVLHGEGTDLALLQEERVGDADAFLALSDSDELNLMSCQLARSLGAPRTVALVQKPDFVAIYQKLGIDVAVSPRLLCSNRILSFVRRGSVSTIATLGEGRAEIVEIEVRPGSRMVGRSLAQAGLQKREVLIAAIVREDGTVVVPTGEDVVQALDSLVAFATHDGLLDLMKKAGR